MYLTLFIYLNLTPVFFQFTIDYFSIHLFCSKAAILSVLLFPYNCVLVLEQKAFLNSILIFPCLILLFILLLDQMDQYLKTNNRYYMCRNYWDAYEFFLVIVVFIIHNNLMLGLNRCNMVYQIIIIAKVFYAFYYS